MLQPARTRLLAGCAVGAIMAAMPSLAQAQAFNGTPNVVTGSANISNSPDGGPGIPATTTVTVFSNETVINWAIFDNLATGNVSFQDAGTVGTFIDGSGLTDYTVLNRLFPVTFGANQEILPTSSTVTIDGTIQSFISGAGANFTGGHIWFYTPNGLIFGPNSRITVGSLIGTTDDIQFTPNCTFACEGFGSIYGANGLVQFRGADGALTTVEVDPGAQITASGANAYVALVAPRVVQGGLIDVNGQAAFLAAEQVDMTINAGLFDFTLLVGTTDPNGVVHNGSTRGPESLNSLDVQRMMFVALPKNDAVTMLLSGSIGYQPASFAFNEGSSIVLSSGFETADPTFLSGIDGNVAIANTDFRNPVTGWATNDITIAPDGGAVTFERDLRLSAGSAINVTVEAGEQVLGSGFAQLRAGVPGAGGRIDILTTDDDVELPGGQFAIQSYLDLNVSSPGIFGTSGGPANATGGDIAITADGGYVYASSLYASAEGIADCGCSSTGDGVGGRITLNVFNGGEIETPYVSAYAGGYGGNDFFNGGDGYGGRITVTESGGLLDLDYLYLDALGRGGDSASEGGDGYAGSALVSVGGQQQDWSYLTIYTNAQSGGPGFDAAGLSGSAFGNDLGAVVEVNGPGALNIGDIYINANAYTQANGVDGFRGEGGTIRVNVTDGGVLSMFGNLYADASARFSTFSSFSPIPDSTPTQVGGDARVTVDGGQLDTFGIDVRAEAATNFAAVAAGSATGGEAALAVLSGGSISLLVGEGIPSGIISISANAFGAPGPMPASATGGLAQLILNDGSISTPGNIAVTANAGVTSMFDEPPAGPGFAATGGTALVDMQAGSLGTASLAASNVDVSALGDARLFLSFGEGGFGQDIVLLSTLLPGSEFEVPLAGNGGDGAGGTAGFNMEAGTLVAGTIIVDTSGIGAASSATTEATPFQSGNGSGGTSAFSLLDSTSATLTSLELYANGLGGGGAPAADIDELAALAGSGFGGTAELTVGNASLTLGLIIEATGTGADGMAHLDTGAGSAGGTGFGGTASLVTVPGGTGTLTLSALDLDAQGYGGYGATSALGLGGDGGEGSGGTASALLSDGAFSIGAFRALADGIGGDGAAGETGNGAAGLGHGGDAQFLLVDSAAGPAGPRSVGDMQFFASGVGGISGSGAVAPGTGGSVAIVAQVLDPASALDLTGGILALSRGTSGAAGTGFSFDISGAILSTAGNVGIDTARDAVINAGQPFDVNGTFTLFSRSLTETGLIAADTIGVTSPDFIDAEQLRSDGTTTLLAVNGPLVVDDLTSFGEVMVQAESVDIGSSGRLIFSLAQATAGDMSIATAGNLIVPLASAAGSMNLRSFNGAISSATGLLAGGDFSAQARNALDLATVSSGGTTLLQSTVGDVLVDSLTSAGTVAVGANNVAIAGSGDLTFTAAQSAGTMSITTGGDLAFAGIDAGGDLDLDASFGSITASGSVSSGAATLDASSDIAIAGGLTATGPLSVTAGNTFFVGGSASASEAGIVADGGIDIAALSSGGSTLLQATSGGIFVGDLQSSGAVTALGLAIDIGSSGGLTFADLDATGGPLSVQTLGDLNLAAADSATDLLLRSLAGGIVATGPVVSGGGATIDGETGITLPSLHSGGTTQLSAASGTLGIAALLSTGPISVNGNAVDIAGLGSLTFDTAQANTTLEIVAAGDLALGSVDTSGELRLRSTLGGLTASGNVSGGPVFLSAESDIALAGDLTANGALSVDTVETFSVAGAAFATSANVLADHGIDVASLNSGGATFVSAFDGPVRIGNLLSTGAVTARGRSVDILSTGALSFADLDATAGNLRVGTVGNLILATSDATGTTTFSSSAGRIAATGAVNSGGVFAASGATGVTFALLNSGGTTLLQALGGTVDVDQLTSTGAVTARGRNVDILSTGGLSFADLDATAGNLRVGTGGNLLLNTSDATGTTTFSSSTGSITATGAVNSGGAFAATGATGLTFPSINSGATTLLQATGGAIDIDQLLSTGQVTASARSVDIRSTGALSFADLETTAGGAIVETAGALTLATADIAGAATFRGGVFVATGDIDADGNVDIVGPGGLSLATLRSGGTTSLVATNGPLAATNLLSPGAVTARGRSIDIASTDALGFAVAEAFNALSIAAGGNLSFGSVTAGQALTLRSTSGSITATGNVTGQFGNLAAGGNILIGGTLASGGNLQVDARGSLTVTGATSTGDATIVADRGIDLASLQSGEITRLIAVSGNIDVPELRTGGRITARGIDVDIASTGGLAFDEATATSRDVVITTGGDLTAQSLFAERAIDLASQGAFTLQGDARAATIDVVSSDIAIESEAQLGFRGETSSITLLNGEPSNDTFVGNGSASEGLYVLDGNEARRVFADSSIFIGVQGEIAANHGALEIGDLAMSFGATGNVGTGGTLEISTPGNIAITGDVLINTSSATDTFKVDPRLVTLATDTGSISLFAGEGGAAQGRLQMVGGSIIIATDSVIDQIVGLTDFGAIRTLLNQPGGTAQPLRAGSMLFDVDSALFIQNTGPSAEFADRRGFTGSGVDIVTRDAATRISINGQLVTGPATFTGLDVIPRIMINGISAGAGGQFDPASTINGCSIGTNCGFVPPPPEPEPLRAPSPPTSDDIETPAAVEDNSGPGLITPLIQLVQRSPLITPPLIDEPITGVGNDDLWEPRCDPEVEACAGEGGE